VIFGIVLAAGLGRRVGLPKALLTLGGDTFHHRAVRSVREAGLGVVVVINPLLEGALPPALPGERRVLNPHPDENGGMFGSVRIGIAEVVGDDASGVILLPVDHPLVLASDVGALVASLGSGAPVAIATHGGRRGHPIGLGRAVMNEILADPSIATLRDIVHRDRGRVIEVPVSEGAVLGINTNEELERVSRRAFL
jgi:CTP:molybdopterin cytidylyltransferase MocA